MLEHLILNGRIEAAYHYQQVAHKNYKDQLLNLFQKGKRQQFMKLLALLKAQEKLEFYIRVYFLIYNIHPALKAKASIPEQQITAFRQYLDTKGADLAKTNEFLQFYALSFVKKPLDHPSYKILFKKQWVSNLTQKLNIFLANEERRMKQIVQKKQLEPKIFKSPQFGVPPERISDSNSRKLEQDNKVMHIDLQNFKRKYHELEKKYQALSQSFNTTFMETQHKWLQNIRELTYNGKYLLEIISKSNSNLIHDRKYQRIKKRNEKYEKMAKKELDQLLNQSQDLSVFDKPSNNEVSYSASATPNVSQRNITTFVTLDQFVPTNYDDLIRDFKKMPDPHKISILQGLSWRIIKSKNKWIRRQTIIGLIVNDLLGLVNGDIQVLLFNKNLMSHVLKLFLYISEDSYGRKVLFRNSGLYKQLIDLIPQTLKTKNYNCIEIVLQIILNIWHNREIFVELINLNIIDICINTLLQDQNVIFHGQLVQSIATMLINATGSEEGLDAFQYQVDVFFYLCEAFKEANDTNRNLIGAVIYGLLGRRKLWKLAHQAKLPAFIDGLIMSDERCNKQQLRLIQSKLHSFEPGKTLNASQYDDDESVDSNLQDQNFQRNEDELNDLEDYIKGHDLIAAKYPLKHKRAEEQLSQINSIMNEGKKVTDVLQDFPEARTDGKRQEKMRQVEKLSNVVRLPEIKQKKQHVQIYNPREQVKQSEGKQYYSYKSPNFKQKSSQKKNAVSVQVETMEPYRNSSQDKKKGISFEQESVEQKRLERVQTAKPDNRQKEGLKKEDKKDRKSAERPEYRIKKSSSVEKGLGNPYKRELAYETNKNSSNVQDYKSIEGIKSPPVKKNRDEVLKQLNQQLRAQKKAEGQQRKVSSKNIPAQQVGQRENTHLKKNNYVATEAEIVAFQSKPKIHRTPPKDEQ